MSNAKLGFGTILKIGSTTIGEITNITPPNRSRGAIDVTNLSSPNNYREFIAGIKDGGEISLRGNLYPGDAGQQALETAFESGSTDVYTIEFPASIGASFTMSGFITTYSIAEVGAEDNAAQFEVTVKVTGKPTFGTTVSTGASNIVLSNTILAPTFSSGVYFYQGELPTGNTSFTVTVTAASHSIWLYVDDVYVGALTSGQASSAISIGAGSVKLVTIIVCEAAKTPKTYKIMVERAAA